MSKDSSDFDFSPEAARQWSWSNVLVESLSYNALRYLAQAHSDRTFDRMHSNGLALTPGGYARGTVLPTASSGPTPLSKEELWVCLQARLEQLVGT